jgi:hypothetical protein
MMSADLAPHLLSDDHDRASLEGAKLRGREGHHSCHERKAKDETQEPDALLTAIAKAPRGWIE